MSGVTAIAAGHGQACAVVSGGVRCWGDSLYSELGDTTTPKRPMPVAVTGISGATAVATNGNNETVHSCALVGGGVKCWGDNNYGSLGDGAWATLSAMPVAVVGVTGATAIAAGYFHTCALVSGDVRCWGFNRYGQVGVNQGWVPEDVRAGTGE